MFRKTDEPMIAICPMPVFTRKLLELEDLLDAKFPGYCNFMVMFGYGHVNVTFSEPENKDAIEFLKFNLDRVTVTKEESKNPDKNTTLVKFEGIYLDSILSKLNELPNPVKNRFGC